MNNKNFLEYIKIFISILLIVLSIIIFFTTYQEKRARGETLCDIGSFYKDEQSPYEYHGNTIVTSVGVKAGTGCTFFRSNGSDECFEVSGLGSSNVTIRQIRGGPECLGISHVAFFANQVLPSNTPTQPPPSPTKTPTPPVSLTPTLTLTPTQPNQPTTTPNPSGSPTPSACPKPNPVTNIKVSCPNCSI